MWSSYEESRKKNREEEEEVDRISRLSDEILHKILSFMNTKFAVQTCVLSNRWKYLWRSLPYLDFNHTTFPFKGYHRRRKVREEDAKIASLSDFITQVLYRRCHTDLVKVCFQSYESERYASIVDGLTAHAFDHNVQQLTIHSGSVWNFVLPQRFYSSELLTALELHDDRGDTIELPKFLALPALESLHLHGFSLTQKCFNWDFSGCPLLESLKLTHIHFGEDKTLFINAPKLKRLELSFRWSDWGNEYDGRKVVIDAPGLMTFQYSSSAPIVCSFAGNLVSIDHAYFDIYNCYLYGYCDGDEEDKEDDMYVDKYREYVLHCIKTLKKFCRAKSVTLSWKTVGALSKFPFSLDENRLPFPNLKSLEIKLEKWQQGDKIHLPRCVGDFFLDSFIKLKSIICWRYG